MFISSRALAVRLSSRTAFLSKKILMTSGYVSGGLGMMWYLNERSSGLRMESAEMENQSETRTSSNATKFSQLSVSAVRNIRAAFAVLRIVALYKFRTYRLHDRIGDEGDREEIWSKAHTDAARIVLDLCRSNGGVYIKLGQHLSALTYLLPVEYTDTLRELQDECPTSSVADVDRVLGEELGNDLEGLFQDFEYSPLGSASLAQVHRAVLRDGRVVAIKIQHLSLSKEAPADIAATFALVSLIAKIFPEFQFFWLAEEMKRNLRRELDFRLERDNAECVERMFSSNLVLRIPRVYTATERVLIMEFIDGKRIDDVEYLKEINVNRKQLVSDLMAVFYDMIFVHGFLHCDPHPGNVFIVPKSNSKETGRNYEIVLLDHGLYRELQRDFQDSYARLWLAIISGNENDIKLHSQNLGAGHAHRLFACILTARSWESVSNGIDSKRREEETAYIQGQASNYLTQICEILASIPRPLLLVLKTNDLLRSIELTLIPSSEGYNTFGALVEHCLSTLFQTDYEKCESMVAKLHLSYWYLSFSVKLWLFKGYHHVKDRLISLLCWLPLF